MRRCGGGEIGSIWTPASTTSSRFCGYCPHVTQRSGWCSEYEALCYIQLAVCSPRAHHRHPEGARRPGRDHRGENTHPGSPYYQINPSGRVPYLVDDTDVGMEDSQLICA